MNRILIVGASAAGLATAEALRRGGHRGAICLIGDETHLPYDRPPLSKQFLAGDWQHERLALRTLADLPALDLDLRLGVAATGVDAARQIVTLANGDRLSYDGLVVATGARPRRLPGSRGTAGVHTLRTLDDALALRAALRQGRRLAIIGGGFVGAEVAATARRLGAEVTVLESGPAPLAQSLGTQTGQYFAGLHQEHGVRIRTGAAVTGILTASGRVTGVGLADGTTVPADDVLVAVGCLPNTEWLHGSGLPVNDGLVCDQYCAAAPGVYAVGDVARWSNPLFGVPMRVEHRTNAAEQGIAVAFNILHPHRRRPFTPVPYVWSDQYDIRIQLYGHVRDHDEAVRLDNARSGRNRLVAYRVGDRLGGVLGIGVPPRTLRGWRARIAARTAWDAAIDDITSTATP
jgi:NADPH-dependent 2,4-dienoyl-CoA reductase/sulfur reductase-like enzyme